MAFERLDMSENITLYRGDCLEVMKTLPDECVDAVVTDPPYGVNLNYNATFDDSSDYWQGVVVPAIKECLRITRGPVFVFGAAPCSRLWPFQLLEPQRMLVWAPRFTHSHTSSNGILYRWHAIWCWRLPEDCEPLWSDVLDIACDGPHWWFHPGTKPVKLMKLLTAATSGTVLDPFMGSGTTGVACAQLGRSFIGIEISEQYFRIAERRIAEAQAQLRIPFEAIGSSRPPYAAQIQMPFHGDGGG